MIDLCLENCKIHPKEGEYSIGVENGKIVEIKKTPLKAEKTIDVAGKLVLPGLIDVHVHFRDPGLTYKEDFKTGSMAAAHGGFTTVLDMPNTIPPTNTAKAFKEKLEIASKKSVVDFGLHAGVGYENERDLEEIKKIAQLNPASFKIFMDLVDGGTLKTIFEKISEISAEYLPHPRISLHPENKDMVEFCTSNLKSKGKSDPSDYADARPALAEEVAISQALALANHYKVPIHLCHVSSKRSLELINTAKSLNCTVSSEITPHHLFLDSSAFEKWGNLTKTNPPLRNRKKNVSIKDLDQIDMIGTDHAPHTLEEKEKNVWDASPGIPNLETILPLLLNQINQNKMTIESLKRLLCENPAKIFNLKQKGSIEKGKDADLVVVDMTKEITLTANNFYSKAEYTPFEGLEVKGSPVMTLLGGKKVMEDNEVFGNKGQFVYYKS